MPPQWRVIPPPDARADHSVAGAKLVGAAPPRKVIHSRTQDLTRDLCCHRTWAKALLDLLLRMDVVPKLPNCVSELAHVLSQHPEFPGRI